MLKFQLRESTFLYFIYNKLHFCEFSQLPQNMSMANFQLRESTFLYFINNKLHFCEFSQLNKIFIIK